MSTEPDDSPVTLPFPLWPQWSLETKPKFSPKQSHAFAKFTQWMQKHAPQVWQGDEALEINTPEKHRGLRLSLCSGAERASDEVLFADWWDRLISAGNLDGRWEIPLLSPIIKLPNQRPSFVRRDFQLLSEYRELEKGFWRLCLRTIEPNQIGDMVMISAVLNGGLLDSRDISALSAISAEAISGFSGRLLVTFQIEVDAGEKRDKHWYPDTITAMLLVRALKSGHLRGVNFSKSRPAIGDAQKNLDATVRRLCLPVCGNNRDDLLRAARVAQSLRISPMSSTFQAGESVSHSLPKEVLYRLNRWEVTLQVKPISGLNSLGESAHLRRQFVETHLTFDRSKPTKDQLKIVRELQGLLTRRSCPTHVIDNLLEKYRGELWPMMTLLAEWVKWLMNKEVRGSAVRSSSARRYLGTVARHLIDVVEDENPLEMDPEDFESLYELASGRIRSEKEVGVYWNRVRDFHDFLYACGAPDIDLSELDGYRGSKTARTSANLISEEQFEAFKKAFSSDDQLDAPRIWPLLAAILGFRCGLRRREVQMLWLRDIHPGSEPCLIVRPSKLADLKSNSSERRIPLNELLPHDELDLLMSFAHRRMSLLGGTEYLLFAYDHEPSVPLSPSVLFDPVTAAFQLITSAGITPFRFHHLRHSFANWIFLSLLSADQPELIDPSLPLLDSPLLSSQRIQNIKNMFFPRLAGTPATITRRNLFLVSALLGHLSPQTTLKHYIHVMDWVAAQETEIALRERLKNYGPSELALLCGLSPSMPFKQPYRTLRDQPIKFIREFVRRELPSRRQVKPIPAVHKHFELTSILQRVNDFSVPHPTIMMIIVARYIRGQPLNQLEAIHNVPRSAIEKAFEAYRQMYAKQSRGKAANTMPLPIPPRNLRDRNEFHNILGLTYEAFKVGANRTNLELVSDLLIRRPGPTSGRIYPGRSLETAVTLTQGLLQMGLAPETIGMWCPYDLRRNGGRVASLESELSILERRGIEIGAVESGQQNIYGKRSNFVIEVSDRRSSRNSLTRARAEGRIRGVNYAAMWIQFASQCLLATRSSIALESGHSPVELIGRR